MHLISIRVMMHTACVCVRGDSKSLCCCFTSFNIRKKRKVWNELHLTWIGYCLWESCSKYRITFPSALSHLLCCHSLLSKTTISNIKRWTFCLLFCFFHQCFCFAFVVVVSIFYFGWQCSNDIDWNRSSMCHNVRNFHWIKKKRTAHYMFCAWKLQAKKM